MGIQPGGTQTVVFVFSPLEAKTYFGDIIIESNGGTATKSIWAVAQIVTSIEDGFIDEAAVTVPPTLQLMSLPLTSKSLTIET